MKNKYLIRFIIGILAQGLSLSQMINFNNKTNFKTPFFTIEKKKYIKPFQENKDTLRNYQNVLYYDNFFALAYLLTYRSLYFILEKELENMKLIPFYRIIIPLQSVLDWSENSILYSQIENYLKNGKIKNIISFFVISSSKWLLAGFNFILYYFAISKLIKK